MAKRRRSGSGSRSSFKDYSLVIVLALVFLFGVWSGFFLAQKNAAWKIAQKKHRAHITRKVTFPTPSFPKSEFERPVRVEAIPTRPEAQVRVEPVVREIPKVIPKKKGPRLAIVIDDFGYHRLYTDEFFSIDAPITLAILPHLAYSSYFAEEGKKRGHEIILHLPLEPINSQQDPGPGLITTNMNPQEIRLILKGDLESVPGVTGVNNHMGSKATLDRYTMSVIVEELRANGLFLLDSMTHPKSVAFEIAKRAGIPTLKRDVFIDNEDNFDYVLKQLEETLRIVKSEGNAVIIGHIRLNTIRAIKEALPRFKAAGIEIVTLKDLLSE